MKAAFTITYEPGIPWLLRNVKRIGSVFNKWYVILSWVQPQLDSLDMSPDELWSKYREPYQDELEELRKIPNVQIVEKPFPDKLAMCQFAYTLAAIDGMNMLMQIDADEWYTKSSAQSVCGVFEQSPVNIMNVPETKWWKFMYPLKGGIWDGYPARLFKVDRNWNFGDHRPPSLIDCNGQIIAQLSPKNLDFWGNAVRGIMDHFCYVDPVQVMLKSHFFAYIRKTHPTYKNYLKWFKESYIPWSHCDANEKWQYHVAEADRVMDFSDRLNLIMQFKRKYPEDSKFLEKYVMGEE